MRAWKWLASTRELQERTFGQDYDRMTLDDRCDYLFWNVFAAYDELSEVAAEFKWKPWTTRPAFVNRERLLGEVVDVAHFLGNMLVALGVSDDEYEEAYQRKQITNRLRQEAGYTGLVCFERATGGLCELPKEHQGEHIARAAA